MRDARRRRRRRRAALARVATNTGRGRRTAAPGAPSAGAKEITAAMWSLASLSSTASVGGGGGGGRADAAAAAADADAAALEATIEAPRDARRRRRGVPRLVSSSASAFGSRAVAECAWAAEKPGGTRRPWRFVALGHLVRDAAIVFGGTKDVFFTFFGARRSESAAEALAARVGAALDAHAPRAVARTLALCASLCVVAGDDESADDAAFRARIVPLAAPLATRALALATSKGRKDVEKRITLKKRKRDDDSEEDANDLASRPSADDLVAALEAVAKLGLAEESRGAEKLDTARVAKKLVRAALSAALTRPAEVVGGALSTESRPEKDPSVKEVLDWRVAGRLEHAAFGALGRGFPRADPGRGNESVSSAEKEKNANRRAQTGSEAERAEDRAVLDRLLRRGAEAARAADANRLAIERGALAALGDAVRAGGGPGRRRQTHRRRRRAPAAGSRSRPRRGRVAVGGPAEEKLLFARGWTPSGVARRNGTARARRVPVRRRPAPPPPPGNRERLFDAAFVRVPSTRGALAASLAALAAVVRPGGDAWAFGAVSEGARRAADAFEERRLFERVETWTFRGRRANKNRSANINSAPGPARVAEYEYSGGGFVVTRARRTAVEAADAEASLERFRRETTLALPVVVPGTAGGDVPAATARRGRSREHLRDGVRRPRVIGRATAGARNYSRSEPRAVILPWVTYPGLFAGGVWDDDAFCSARCPRRRSARRFEAFAFLDFCSGSGRPPRARSSRRATRGSSYRRTPSRSRRRGEPRVRRARLVRRERRVVGLPAAGGDEAFDLVAPNPPVPRAPAGLHRPQSARGGCGRRLAGAVLVRRAEVRARGGHMRGRGRGGRRVRAADDRSRRLEIKNEPSRGGAAQSRGFESESEGEKDGGASEEGTRGPRAFRERSKKEKKEKRRRRRGGRGRSDGSPSPE